MAKAVLPALAAAAQPVPARVALLAPVKVDSLALERVADPAVGQLAQAQADWSALEMDQHQGAKVG